jgi:hypothetical protein
MYIYKKGSTEIAQTKYRGGLIGENFFRLMAEGSSAPPKLNHVGTALWYGVNWLN